MAWIARREIKPDTNILFAVLMQQLHYSILQPDEGRMLAWGQIQEEADAQAAGPRSVEAPKRPLC